MIKKVLFYAQAPKQFQSNVWKYQDNMKDHPTSTSKTRVTSRAQKSLESQIEDEKVLEAYVKH